MLVGTQTKRCAIRESRVQIKKTTPCQNNTVKIETKIKNKIHSCTKATGTHPIIGILVGAGIQQQPSAVRVTIVSGTNQRRVSVLSSIWVLDARM
jgi:hypothetical protein